MRGNRLRHFAVPLWSLATVAFALAGPQTDRPIAAAPTFDKEAVEKGRAAYGMFCQACHGAEDASIDSPSNLFDQKWYHGDGRDSIERTIRQGISDKGMPAWGQMISDDDINSLLAYLLSFQTPDSTKDE